MQLACVSVSGNSLHHAAMYAFALICTSTTVFLNTITLARAEQPMNNCSTDDRCLFPLSPPRQSVQSLAVCYLLPLSSPLSPSLPRCTTRPEHSPGWSRHDRVSRAPHPACHRGSPIHPPSSPICVDPTLRLTPGADAARSDERRFQACSRWSRACLKLPLIRPNALTLGVSLSIDSMRIGLVG